LPFIKIKNPSYTWILYFGVIEINLIDEKNVYILVLNIYNYF